MEKFPKKNKEETKEAKIEVNEFDWQERYGKEMSIVEATDPKILKEKIVEVSGELNKLTESLENKKFLEQKIFIIEKEIKTNEEELRDRQSEAKNEKGNYFDRTVSFLFGRSSTYENLSNEAMRLSLKLEALRVNLKIRKDGLADISRDVERVMNKEVNDNRRE